MIQVFDTHCMSYRNAKLRAFALADNTRRLDFYNFANINISDADNCGNEIETDEAGYLFYGNGQHRILCLGLQEAAIIEVSLDGGTTWQIQWIIRGQQDSQSSGTPATLSWKNTAGAVETYSPAGSNKVLPDFMLKREFRAGQWAEEELILTADDATAQVPPWVKTILISLAAPSTITLTAMPRAGQAIVVNSCKNCTIMYDDGIQPARRIANVTRGHSYILVRFNPAGGYTHGYPMMIDMTDNAARIPDAVCIQTTPVWLELASHVFETRDTYRIPENGTIVINFDYRDLPGSGWATGVTNVIHVKAYFKDFLKWPVAFVAIATVAYPGASNTALTWKFDLYEEDDETMLAELTIGTWNHTTTTASRNAQIVKYCGNNLFATIAINNTISLA